MKATILYTDKNEINNFKLQKTLNKTEYWAPKRKVCTKNSAYLVKTYFIKQTSKIRKAVIWKQN